MLLGNSWRLSESTRLLELARKGIDIVYAAAGFFSPPFDVRGNGL